MVSATAWTLLHVCRKFTGQVTSTRKGKKIVKGLKERDGVGFTFLQVNRLREGGYSSVIIPTITPEKRSYAKKTK